MAQGKYAKRARSKRVMKSSKKGPTTKALNKKIHRIENTFMELKSHEVGYAGAVIPTAGLLWGSQCLLGQGVNKEQRVGDSINVTSITFRFVIVPDILLVLNTNIRCIVFWDRQVNGALPDLTGSVDSLLDDNAGTIANPLFQYQALSTQARYKILFDKIYQINPTMINEVQNDIPPATNNTLNIVPNNRYVTKYIKTSRAVKYVNSTTAITSLSTNGLYVAFFTDLPANQPAITGSARIVYRDS